MAPELYRATRALKLTDKNEVVEADQPDGHFKFVDEGGFVSPATAAEFGLTEELAADFGLEPAKLNDAHPQAGSVPGNQPGGAPAQVGLGINNAARPTPRPSGASEEAATHRRRRAAAGGEKTGEAHGKAADKEKAAPGGAHPPAQKQHPAPPPAGAAKNAALSKGAPAGGNKTPPHKPAAGQEKEKTTEGEAGK